MKTSAPWAPRAWLFAAALLGVALGCDECIPDPDPPPGANACLQCHQPDEKGIETAHPWVELSCVDCHGGDETFGLAKEASHVPRPEGLEPEVNIKTLAADQLDDLDPDYLRFINPGDLRVAEISCGKGSPNSMVGIVGCHQGVVEKNQRSVMSTFTGHYNVPRFLAGLQDRPAVFGARDIVHEEFDPATAPPGAVAEIKALRPPAPDAERLSMGAVMDNYLVKSCPTCHAYSFGPNQHPGQYRSSGCTSCHMVYKMTGLSESKDPTVDKSTAPHPAKHELTSAIPTFQCAHCHYQGARIGLLYQGFREHGFGQLPEGAQPLYASTDPRLAPYREIYEGWDSQSQGQNEAAPPRLYGRFQADFYVSDEDVKNNIDETPADVHFSAGMDCADCHVGQDVHGDGNMYSTAKYQVGIRCEDCHGTVRAEIEERDDGFFYTTGGDPLKNMRREGNAIVLKSRRTGQDHVSRQVKAIVEADTNSYAARAMGINAATGTSHTDTVECYTCHTAYRQSCYGCHVNISESRSQYDHQTGTVTQGKSSGSRQYYSLTDLFFGTNARGKVATVCPSEQMFISLKDENGDIVFENQVRTTASGKLGFGWNANFQHTTTSRAQPCSRCHVRQDQSNLNAVRGSYGFGTGQYEILDGDGVAYDPTRILDENGEPIVDFAHSGAGAVPADMIQRALNVPLLPTDP
jgi:hypothetical protein